MATVAPETPPVLQAVPITSVQPGGGTCMGLELAWGRWRRAFLRRFRPAYVAEMKARRQGECPNCPHDIIDPRDLKYYRNVCGYWFRPEDDPFRWRERIPLARMGMVEIACCTFGLLPLAAGAALAGVLIDCTFWLPSAALLGLWVFSVGFFRDPWRALPEDPAALVSPADGTVTHVEEAAEPDFPGGKAFRISIFLSVLNVHVNRIPRTGKIVGMKYFPGCFLDARQARCGVANEQLWLDIDDAAGGRRLRVKQIAGKIARRIVCWLKPGAEVRRGERFGMIKFGSRTEIYLPVDTPMEVLVKIGDRVQGGSTVLLRLAAPSAG